LIQEVIATAEITGCVLCGGQGRRMNNLNKGLQEHQGMTLVERALQRLAPQVGPLMVNANRHLSAYRAFGVPVWPDIWPGHAGPLAGFLSAITHCQTPYLMVVPCDVPEMPMNLVAHLSEALEACAAIEMTIPVTCHDQLRQKHPVFCFMKAGLSQGLQSFLGADQRKVTHWCDERVCSEVLFDDSKAFTNINSLAQLHRPLNSY
jgi:molybdenum cofactor guanylyltransferase